MSNTSLKAEYNYRETTNSIHIFIVLRLDWTLASWVEPLCQPCDIKLSCSNLFFIVLQVVMIGNHDGISVQKRNFSSPINARFIRVHPIAPKGKICLRMELYGCRNRKLLICDFSFSFLVSEKYIAWQAASFVGAYLSNETWSRWHTAHL